MEVPRSNQTGLHCFVSEGDRVRAAQSVENLRRSNESMKTFITTPRKNWHQRRKIVIAVGTVTTLSLIGLGWALFKKGGPIH